MKIGNLRKWLSVVCLASVLVLTAGGVACATGTGAGLHWEQTIKIVADSLSGPVTFSICVLAMFAGGAAIAFGADLPGWVRSVAQIALVAGLIGSSTSLLGAFGLSAAMVL